MTIIACGEKIRQGDGECCETCFVGDTHGLLEPTKDVATALRERIDKVESSLLAEMIILRTDLMEAVKLAGQSVAHLERRLDVPEERLERRIDELEERLAHFDHAQAVVDYGLVDEDLGSLEDRVDIVEQCIEGIERKLKLKRRQPPIE